MMSLTKVTWCTLEAHGKVVGAVVRKTLLRPYCLNKVAELPNLLICFSGAEAKYVQLIYLRNLY